MPRPSRKPGPPHNPGVRDLVAGKRRFSSPPNREDAMRGFKGWHERGYLPHRDEPGLVQFVTFQLPDSFPESLRSEWAALFEVEDDDERRLQLESYLDRGRGECLFRRPDLAALMDGALRFYHGRRCEMRAWVVMPNHVHALFKVDNLPMARIVADWKEYTAREVNKILGRTGRVWAADYWDTFMRNTQHEQTTRHYIENNPVKALLVREAKDWPCSSARFRDEYGELRW